MRNFIYVAISLDGYIARENGEIDWLMRIPNPEKSDYGFSDFMENIDAIIMGRKTFETVSNFDIEWPYSKPVFILSNSIKSVPKQYEDKAEIINGDVNFIVDTLNYKGFKNLYIDGGKTIQSFLKLDLIDEVIITTIPIILGSGIPLFEKMEIEINFELKKTEILSKQLVKSTYIRKE
jgi:dihydrofolate reductase